MVCRRDLAVKALQLMEMTLQRRGQGGGSFDPLAESMQGTTTPLTHDVREDERSQDQALVLIGVDGGGGEEGVALHQDKAAFASREAAVVLPAEPCTIAFQAPKCHAPQTSASSSIMNNTTDAMMSPPPSGGGTGRRVDSLTIHGVRPSSSSRLQRLGFATAVGNLIPKELTGSGGSHRPVGNDTALPASKARGPFRKSLELEGSSTYSATAAVSGRLVSLFRNITARGTDSVSGGDARAATAEYTGNGSPIAQATNEQQVDVRHNECSQGAFKFAVHGWDSVKVIDAGSYM